MVGGLAKRKYIPHPGLSRGNSVIHELVSDVGYETCNYPSIFNRLQLHREHLLSKKYVASLSNLMGSILRLKWERELQHMQTASLQLCTQYGSCTLGLPVVCHAFDTHRTFTVLNCGQQTTGSQSIGPILQMLQKSQRILTLKRMFECLRFHLNRAYSSML